MSEFSFVLLQNPVNTTMWLTANFQLLGPIVSLSVDTKLFVQPIFRTGPLLFFTVIYTSLASLAIMVGPARHANLFRLYKFPQLFRFQNEGLGVGGVVFFYTFITLTRYALKHFQLRKVLPSPLPASSG